MTTPSNAAKAASILHHTWGIESSKAAVEVYNLLEFLDEEDFARTIGAAEGWGIYECFENLPVGLLWDNIYSLACSIDTCREELS